MRKQGEFLFDTFQEALDFVANPTNFEKQQKISVVEKKIMLNSDDFKVIRISKSDKTNSIVLFFKNSTKYDIWKFWMPSKNQQRLLPFASEILLNIDASNVGLRK